MFDIGFWELVVVGVVTLVVIGPKDLPRVARLAGLWLGRARRTLTSVKDEIDRELKAQELQEIMKKQAQGNPLRHTLEEPLVPPQPVLGAPAEALHPAAAADQGRRTAAPVGSSAKKS